MLAVRGVTVHHTASGRGTGDTLGLSTVQNGRGSELPGPLAHLYLNRSGVFYVVAAGLSYHAGVSRRSDQTNSYRIGIEALAEGLGWSQDWPAAQYDALAVGCRALASRYGFPISEVLGHKETCSPVGRKIDPSFDMVEFRRRVATATTDQENEEEDMSFKDKHKLTDADVRAYGQAGLKKGDEKSFGEIVRFPPAVARLRREQSAQATATMKAVKTLQATVESLAVVVRAIESAPAGGPVTSDLVDQIMARLTTELADLELSVSVGNDNDDPES